MTCRCRSTNTTGIFGLVICLLSLINASFHLRKKYFWAFGLVICFVSFRSYHLGKDSGKDKLSKGREEEKSPVETKDVDHLDENLQNKIHQIWNMTFFTKIIGSSEPASKRSPCFVHTSQTGNWSQGKLGRTSAGITRSDLYKSVGLSITTAAKKNYLVELLRHTGVPLFVDSHCSITKRKFAGSPEKKTIIQHQFF